MDWNDLRHFLAAHRHRSLAGAARELGCEHTTVGRRIAALEAALSTRLFTRTPEGLAPTAAGDALAPLAEEMERTVRAIERSASGHDERVEGVVRVTTSETFAVVVIKWLGELRGRHPELRVEVLSDNRVYDLVRGDAEIALRFAATPQRDLVVRKLIDVNWAMYAAQIYLDRLGPPAPVEDLAGHEVVGYDETLASAPGARWLADHGAGARVVFRGNSLHAVREAAAAGMGLTVLPCQVAAREPRLVRVSPEVLGSRSLCLVVHPDLAKVARVRTVMDFLAEIVAKEKALLAG